MADRSAINRALAKAIAYQDCGKPELAAAWAARLCTLLGARGILVDQYADADPEALERARDDRREAAELWAGTARILRQQQRRARRGW